MQGAIAAGSRPTAEAGARVLEEGGNAVDACLAAAFAASVAEGPLTGPTGGVFFLGLREPQVSTLFPSTPAYSSTRHFNADGDVWVTRLSAIHFQG